jgi:hypothetical protein
MIKEVASALNRRLMQGLNLRERLLPLMSNCNLVDESQWDCPVPDFNYLRNYQYTFATFVMKKNYMKQDKDYQVES